ncbi:dTDP-4-dehydrorhamnose reductase [Halotalea alkalilenta]|uniref:dTDP-4-dehydrorhamnose reductase n=1 Tax=Halotalea alkalilenta TaxID=376489 RepID=UPI0004807D8D|nr:dTDP-4-dehydrorhamnose reductase [Halotalea alkalilenta]
MSRRVLVVGATGQVGTALLERAPLDVEAIGVGSSELDLTDPGAIDAAFARWRPEQVINAAAYTAVDRAESQPELAFAVNRDGPARLGRAAAAAGIPVLHVSTDYVFSGDCDRPYREDDPTAPNSVYGASKLAGERALLAASPESLVLRTSWVFGIHGQNFVKTMLRLGVERDELGIVADQWGCPTSAVSIAEALWRLSDAMVSSSPPGGGVYHFAGAPACTWYDFAETIFQRAQALAVLARVPRLRRLSTDEYPTPAHRPAWSVLDCSKLEREAAIAPSDWRVDLESMLAALAVRR